MSISTSWRRRKQNDTRASSKCFVELVGFFWKQYVRLL